IGPDWTHHLTSLRHHNVGASASHLTMSIDDHRYRVIPYLKSDDAYNKWMQKRASQTSETSITGRGKRSPLYEVATMRFQFYHRCGSATSEYTIA
ncbi:10422_t:CDS:2, partial [Gigaspora margarita]